MTKRRAIILIFIVWGVALFLAAVPFGDNGNFGYIVDYMTFIFTLVIKFNQNMGKMRHIMRLNLSNTGFKNCMKDLGLRVDLDLT